MIDSFRSKAGRYRSRTRHQYSRPTTRFVTCINLIRLTAVYRFQKSWRPPARARRTPVRRGEAGSLVVMSVLTRLAMRGVSPEDYHDKIATARASTCPFGTCQAHSPSLLVARVSLAAKSTRQCRPDTDWLIPDVRSIPAAVLGGLAQPSAHSSGPSLRLEGGTSWYSCPQACLSGPTLSTTQPPSWHFTFLAWCLQTTPTRSILAITKTFLLFQGLWNSQKQQKPFSKNIRLLTGTMYSHQPPNYERGNANVPSHLPNRSQRLWATEVHPHHGPTEDVDNAIQYAGPGPLITQTETTSRYQGYGGGAQGIYWDSANTAHCAGGAPTNTAWEHAAGHAQVVFPLHPQYQQASAAGTATRHTAQPPFVLFNTSYPELDSASPYAAGETVAGSVDGNRQTYDGRSSYSTPHPAWQEDAHGDQDGSIPSGGGFGSQPVETTLPTIGPIYPTSPEAWQRYYGHRNSEDARASRTPGHTPVIRQEEQFCIPRRMIDSEQRVPSHLHASVAVEGIHHGRNTQSLRVVDSRSRSRSSSTGSGTSQDPVVCLVCGKEYNGEYRKGNLARHRRQKHGKREQSYPCEESCSQVFKRQDARLKHYRKHHPWLVSQPLNPRQNGSSFERSVLEMSRQHRVDRTPKSASVVIYPAAYCLKDGPKLFHIGPAACI
ncbi:hypothetical protein P171DRAFT_441837 [Karstenula rhodostoma CBS 690.94]|uniref:C2H2-type domain-containing protein n=1 Tax=Karstenula rhodostoma CBS 690.94 TaxID=1392251 RepID=A0A9P4PS34_9PLEO|nr:hypothetical protein P171DRAFT_441837 [Karstenula rhodostoma CBS 690.94]